MNNDVKVVYVYENWSSEIPKKIGELFFEYIKGEEIVSFEYDKGWLIQDEMFQLDPDLELYNGRQYPLTKNQFGLFSDSSPDRWGRTLLKMKEADNASIENRKIRKLCESDYLLGVDDETRMGALRFKLEVDGVFLESSQDKTVPPFTSLRDLEEASRMYEKGDTKNIEKWLNQLIQPGSSLGGARPKSSVRDVDNTLWIAKFPSKTDNEDIGAWEKVAHDLAKLCNLNVPETKLKKFSEYGSTLLIKRFDRCGKQRIHFASAMTMLGKVDGDSSESNYLDIANFIKEKGVAPREDLLELWKRIVFNMLISNTDDHLRNHGFILDKPGWRLSPLYDINPTIYGTNLSLNVVENDSRLSIELAIEFARKISISEDIINKTINEMVYIVKTNWEEIAAKYKINKQSIDSMKSAFHISDEYEIDTNK